MQLSDWHLWFKRRGGTQLRQLVMNTWDPIGVRGVAEAHDEYDGYLGGIADAVRRDLGEAAIADLLTGFATENIGLRPNQDRDIAAARAITQWYAEAMAAEEARTTGRPSAGINEP